MAIGTYDELKIAIANWADRTNLTAKLGDFILLAESDIRPVLFVSQMETRAYATMSTSSPYLALPTAFVSVRRVQLVSGSIDYQLQEIPASDMSRLDDGGSGMPRYYSIIGEQFQFHPQPDSEYRIEITYFKDVPALSDSNTTNWILDDYPNVYLFGALKHLSMYIEAQEQIARYHQLFEKALDDLKKQSRRRKYGGHPMFVRVA